MRCPLKKHKLYIFSCSTKATKGLKGHGGGVKPQEYLLERFS